MIALNNINFLFEFSQKVGQGKLCVFYSRSNKINLDDNFGTPPHSFFFNNFYRYFFPDSSKKLFYAKSDEL